MIVIAQQDHSMETHLANQRSRIALFQVLSSGRNVHAVPLRIEVEMVVMSHVYLQHDSVNVVLGGMLGEDS